MKRKHGIVISRSFIRKVVALAVCMALLTGCSMQTMSRDIGMAKVASIAVAFASEKLEERELHVGNPTATKGDFFTEMFGNGTADVDVRTLLHGYDLVNWDQGQGVYVLDPSVVWKSEVTTDAEGNRSYRLTLWEDLQYSDGTPITAWDYAFSLLLMMSPEIEQIGGKIYRAEHILGYRQYLTGESETLRGVHVTDKRTLTITLDHEFLPYFYEVGLLMCTPYPIGEIAPGCRVYDTGEGVYIGNEDESIPERLYNADLLAQTILDPETGYRSHPAVTSGPYVLTSYDGTVCRFAINPYYKGAWEGSTTAPAGVSKEQITRTVNGEGTQIVLVKPSIQRLSYTVADNDTLVESLESGTLDLVNKVSYGPVIEELQKNRELSFSKYPRVGLAYLTFRCERATVNEMAVRQAIAWCMDRDRLTEEYCGKNGFRVDGYFGIEQWEYKLINGQTPYPVELVGGKSANKKPYANLTASTQREYDAMVAAWKALSLDKLTKYTVNTSRANALLDGAGWTLNKEGEQYDARKDEVRYKRIDGELVALELTMMYPAGNHIVDTLQENFIDHLAACGIVLKLEATAMPELLSAYYRQAESDVDMIYLATNFNVVVDPAITFSTDATVGHQVWNNTYSDDEELYQRAVEMRKTEPGDMYGYVEKWIAFQERYNEVLPAIPVYSNYCFDFWTPELHNYRITAHTTWPQAIMDSNLSGS